MQSVFVAVIFLVWVGDFGILGFPVQSAKDFVTTASPGCGKAAPYDPATTGSSADFSFEIGGHTRHYLLKLPKSYDTARARTLPSGVLVSPSSSLCAQNKPYPIILSFHGWGGFATGSTAPLCACMRMRA